jgi:hypothetical protein
MHQNKVPSIVFVHLNSQLPQYLLLNLHAANKIFPDKKIVLIHNLEQVKHRIEGIEYYKFESSEIFLQIENRLAHPKEFRNNFWFTAIGRFEALRDYMENSNESIIHVESDVILSKDFPFKKFQEIQTDIAFPLVANNRGVASTLFIGNIEAARKLVDFTLGECKINPGITDMEILSRIIGVSELKVLLLPIGLPDKKYFRQDNMYPHIESLEANFRYFGGVFDGNDIGVYLYGSNPRNRRGISKVGEEITGNFAATSSWKFIYNTKRYFIDIDSDSSAIPIFSLHVTCKRRSIFCSFSRSWALRKIHRNKSSSVKIYPDIAMLMTFLKMQKIFFGTTK